MKQIYYYLQKVILFISFLTLYATTLQAQTLTISTIDAGPYTPGSSIAVPFNINTSGGCINADNVFKLYISSVPGGTPDTEIGTYTSFYAAFLNGTIPAGLAAGSYNLAVKSSDPATTSATASINIVAGAAITASISGTGRINSDNPEIFGNCSGSSSNYTFFNASTTGASVTASFRNEFSQANDGPYTLNPSKSFNAGYSNYTILVKATNNGTEATKAYQLINNKLNTSFGTTGTNTVCLINGTGQLSYTVDYTSPNGIQYNYPGNVYIVNWGDGSQPSIYTLCDIKNLGGVLSHPYTQPSCGSTSGNQANSFQVNAQVSSRICGTLGSPITSYAKVVRPPTNSFTAPLSACLNEPVTFNNTSDPGQDASGTGADCTNSNAQYTWYIDGVAQEINYTVGTSFTYTFTTPGQHTIKLELQSQSGSVCGADPLEKHICILAKPQPAFTVDASTICSSGVVTATDGSVIDNSCANIPQNNAYTWSVTGPAAISFINGTTAASHSPQIQFFSPGIYTLTLSIGTESCGNVSTSQTITVNTTPTVSLSPDKIYCGTSQTLTFANNAGATQTIFTGTATELANTYSWTVTGGNYSYQNGTSATSKYPQILFTDYSIYTVTATQTNNCGTATASQHLDFRQSPTISAGADQTICPDVSTQLTGTVTGPTPQNYSYHWTGGSGTFSDVNSLTATYTPTNAEISSGQVKLTLVVFTGNPSPCDQLSDEVIININPRNAGTSSTVQSICTGTTFSYHPTSQISGSTFTWTSSPSSNVMGNTASGSGDINDVLTSSEPIGNGTVVYTITPASNGCPGTSFTVTVSVTPRPVITVNKTSNTICDGQPTGISFTSNLPSGTTFKWTATSSPDIYGANNQAPVNARHIDDVLQNGTTSPGTVTYVITPISAAGCEGTPVTVVVTVEPAPIQANAGTDQQICNASAYTLSGNPPGNFTGLWTLTSGQQGITFADATQYNTTASGLQGGQNYTFRWTISGAPECAPTTDDVAISNLNPLTNNISYSSAAVCYGQTITVTGDIPTGGTNSFVYAWESSTDNVTWTSLSGQSNQNLSILLTSSLYLRRIVTSGPCIKISNAVYILVQPPIAGNIISANQQVCYNTTPVLLNGTMPTGGDGNFYYQWQQSIDNGATWNTITGATGLNYQPEALITTTQFRRIVTTALCNGDQQNLSNLVTIIVSPDNTNMLTSASTQTVCTGTLFSYHITAQAAGTTFTWTSSATANVSGNAASGSGDISNTLINADPNSNGTVTYLITPYNNNCPGKTFALTVTVTPLPVITVNTTTNTICSGQPTGISFSSNLSGTQFKWTTTATAGTTGNNNQVPVYASRIDDILTNTTTANGTVTYTITPISASGCEGLPVTVAITVQPQPIQAIAGADEQICAASTYVLKGNNPAPFIGMWTITSGQQGVIFTDATQYNTTVSGLQPGQQYGFRWTISSTGLCAATTDDVVISNLQSLSNNISFGSPAICYSQTATVLGDQATGGTGSFVYSWESSTDNNTWVPIANQAGRDYSFTGTQNIYIRRIVTSGPCTSISTPVYIIVQPAITNNTISADQLICYNNVPVLLNGSTPAGADGNFIYQWQQSADNGITWTNISSAAAGTYQPDALTATTQFRRIVTSAVCSGSQQSISNSVTITVQAQNTNFITSDASRIICTGTNFSYHPTAQQTGTSFTWVSSATANISGNSASGSGDINNILVNSDPNNNGTVTYIITPVNFNCPGTPFTLTVTVTPIPRVIITNSGKEICSGQPTGITFTTNTPGVTVKWTFDRVEGIFGANNQYPVIATRIDDILTSDRTTPGTIVYHLTPISEGGCEGPTVDATVTVLPQPVQANAGADEDICSASTYTLNGNNPAPSTGRWSLVSGQSGIGFADAAQYNTAVSGLQPGQKYTFRWTITSIGACATSADEVVINDLRDLTNNISFASPAVCYGQTITVAGDVPTGGTGSFVYSWEISTDNINWTSISGQNDQNYSFTGTQNIYVRRMVSSGPCSKISQPVYIIVQPPITNNTVASDQQVCYNNTPKLLTGSTPAGADGNYSYQWQSSTDNGATWTNITGATTASYQVNSLTVTTIFRRIVTSVLCTGPQQSASNVITVTVNPLPNATFSYNKDLGCIPFVLDAQNIKATDAPGNNTYTWYADGVFVGSGFTLPGYTITEDDKKVEIKLVVTSKFGCPDASFTHIFTTIKEVTAGFSQDQTKGCGPMTVKFTNTSSPQNAATYSWNFGNGTTSTLVNPQAVVYQPQANGRDTVYTITLRAATTCGIRTFVSTVLVRPKPISIFSPDKTVGCSPFTVNFNNTSPGTNNTYTFDFGDGETLVTTDLQTVSHTYITPVTKSYIVKMTATNECGSSTTQYTIRTTPNTILPQLIVNGDQKSGCAPFTVQFYNNTKGATFFTYDFGDGTTISTLNAPEVVTHTFLKDGIFNVKLRATNGCSDTSAYQSITVYPQPVTNFTSDVQSGCKQLNVNFKNLTAGSNNTYLWDFGDGSTSTSVNPTHTFSAGTTPFTVSLIAKNSLGCTDTMVMKNYISVYFPPQAAFSPKPDSVIAYPYYSFSFADKSTRNPILWKWNFGDGISSGKQNPQHTYRDTGLYKVQLIVYNLQGCADSITHTVQITGVPGQLFVPNAFMPTSRFNDIVTFKPKGSGIKTYRMRVFNKWGQVVWESTKLTGKGEPAEGWDGLMNGQPAPQGVYIWEISATYLNGNDWKGMSYNGGAPNRQGVIHLIK